MLAMLFEITSTLVCCACMPVPAISSERMLRLLVDLRQQLVDHRLQSLEQNK
jgi:hypothetical protein